MSLKDWLRNRWLVEHEPSLQEIGDLMTVVDRDLADCQSSGLSPDWRLTIAYNGALQIATAALTVAGYRASREAHHHRVIQSLAYTIGVEQPSITLLDGFRKKRNIADYERAGTVSDQEAREMIALALRLRGEFIQWLSQEHPDYFPKEAGEKG